MSKRPKANVRLVKAQNSLDVEKTAEERYSGIDGILPTPYPIKELQALVENSTILQQCVDAYKRNIVGFGADPVYLEDYVVAEETPEMKAEHDKVKSFMKHFNYDMSFTDVWGNVIEDKEITGNGYLEVIRDGADVPVEGNRLNPAFIWVSKQGELVEAEVLIDGIPVKRKRRFRKYVQDMGSQKVYFKEFGDLRKMDSRTGEYVDTIDLEYEANEVLHLKIGQSTYGVPRWIGQLIHMYGTRKAEELNYRYFTQGRHTPMAILLHNAELSPESEQALVDYASSVEGSDNAHKFLIIEAEGLEEGILQDEKKNAKVEVKSLADMLQQDALFLEYDDASRQKVQSAFRLPDIYVGRSKDFNRATADTARYITEEQVFEPERNSLEWIINNKFFAYLQLKYTQMNFSKPEISNVLEIVSVLDVGGKLNALAPNDVRDVLGKLLGKEFEPFEGEHFDVPSGSLQAQAQLEGMQIANEQTKSNPPQSDKNAKSPKGKNEQVKKVYEGNEFINLLKDMKDVLEELKS